jgi:Flp pilus assembly protein TadG
MLLFALSLPVVIGGVGFGVETTYWYRMSRSLQAAADAAAYAGALERTQGSDNATVTAVSVMTAQMNGYSGNAARIDPNFSSNGDPAVKVELTRNVDRFFTAIFQTGSVGLSARAVATIGGSTASNNCVLALGSSTDNITLTGNADLRLTGCRLASNSTANPAISVTGSATLRADCVEAVGPVSLGSRATLSGCSAPVQRTQPVADPYGAIAEPTASGSCLNANLAVLSPGRYCAGLKLNKNTTLLPGVYHISGDDFAVSGNATISGAGVTIFLDGGSGIQINGNSKVNLSAPTVGSTQGILFFGDRGGNGTATFNGNGSSTFVGAFYLPGQSLNFSGNSNVDVACSRMVARSVRWTGSGTVNGSCSNPALNQGSTQSRVMLTE